MNSYCLYIDKSVDPYFNLAAEEYLFVSSKKPIVRLWRNNQSVIVGRNQNTIAEINSSYVERYNIPVVRRLSGGGAVFHDLGNINFTFIDNGLSADTTTLFRTFTDPICRALRSLGLQVELTGRNDLTIDGKKISGNAIYLQNGRRLLHGTLLFSASESAICGALNSSPKKYEGKGITSHRARITNISDHLDPSLAFSVDSFMEYLCEKIVEYSPNCSMSEFTHTDIEAIDRLKLSKYTTYEWNYGKSPNYTYSNKIKLPTALVELYLYVEKGIITQCRIMGDYFFVAPINELENSLIGVPHDRKQIAAILQSLPIDKYLCGVEAQELSAMF